jgi:hypothetical protein
VKRAGKGAVAQSAPGSETGMAGGASVERSRPGRSPPRHISSQEALENTRELLAAKQARTRRPPAWQEHDTAAHAKMAKSGFESESARDRAVELHQDEMRLQANEGGISDRDHHQQGRRDNR